MSKKRIRLLTNRNFPENDTAFEYIEMEEIDGKQYLYHRMGETRLEVFEDGDYWHYKAIPGEGCFPISVDLVQERFQELGRSYVPTGKEVAKTVEDLMVKGPKTEPTEEEWKEWCDKNKELWGKKYDRLGKRIECL